MSPRQAPAWPVSALASGLLLAIPQAPAQPSADPPPAAEAQQLSGRALLERAALHASLDELDAAEADYLDGIERITAAEGEFSVTLIEAYRGLAEVFARRGEYAEAVTVLEQARHISHRNYGLFNLEQSELLDDLSRVLEAAGDTREAQAMQREMLEVAMRRFGDDGTAVVPYHYRLAEYYEAARMRVLAREQYETALEILEDDPTTAPGELLKPLRELLRIDTILGEPNRSRRRLEAALEAAPDAAARERAEALAALGDAALVEADTEAAMARYRQAYAALRPSGAAEQFFARPRLIDFVPPPSPVDFGSRRRRAYAWGSITAQLRLSAQGRAQNIQIVASDPPGLMDAAYSQRLAQAVFRPRLVAGEPVATPRLRYSHEFRYFVPDEE